METAIKSASKILLLFLLISACNQSAYYDVFLPVQGTWHADSVKRFTVEIEDNKHPFAILMKMRHNANYPYSNLYLFRTIESENGLEYADTVNLLLANPQGKWLGSGVGELKTMEWIYAERGLQFTNTGFYTFTVQHGMRDTLLDGIMDIGLELSVISEDSNKK